MFVGLGMAEIVSAIPTSGGPYFWAAILAPKSIAPLASWVTGWYDGRKISIKVALLIMRQVQSTGPGRSHHRHYFRVGKPHLNNRYSWHKLRTYRWEDLRHIRCSVVFPRCDQLFRGPRSPLPEQHFDHFAFGGYQLLLHCCPGQSSDPSVGQVRLLYLL